MGTTTTTTSFRISRPSSLRRAPFHSAMAIIRRPTLCTPVCCRTKRSSRRVTPASGCTAPTIRTSPESRACSRDSRIRTPASSRAASANGPRTGAGGTAYRRRCRISRGTFSAVRTNGSPAFSTSAMAPTPSPAITISISRTTSRTARPRVPRSCRITRDRWLERSACTSTTRTAWATPSSTSACGTTTARDCFRRFRPSMRKGIRLG